MPLSYACPHCTQAFSTRQLLGAHKRWVHSNMAPTRKHPSQGSVIPAPSVPIPCAVCFARMPDVEKGLAVVLIRAGMSIERAQKTVLEMRAILAKHNGHP